MRLLAPHISPELVEKVVVPRKGTQVSSKLRAKGFHQNKASPTTRQSPSRQSREGHRFACPIRLAAHAPPSALCGSLRPRPPRMDGWMGHAFAPLGGPSQPTRRSPPEAGWEPRTVGPFPATRHGLQSRASEAGEQSAPLLGSLRPGFNAPRQRFSVLAGGSAGVSRGSGGKTNSETSAYSVSATRQVTRRRQSPGARSCNEMVWPPEASHSNGYF